MIKALLVLAILAQLCLGFRTGPGYVQMNRFRDPSASGNSGLRKRDSYEAQLFNTQNNEYFVDMTVGTPPQEITVQLDTGSSDLWFMSSSNPLCADPDNDKQVEDAVLGKGGYILCTKGTFSENASSTVNMTDSAFFISYGDGSMAIGRWATDKVQLGNITVEDMFFGVSNGTVSDTGGILGIGLAADESWDDEVPQYPNFPARLAQDGLISANAYSLWLDDVDSQNGSILFGAVDHAKYSGSLYTFPIVPTGDDDDSDDNSTTTGGNNSTTTGNDSSSGLTDLAVTLSSVRVSTGSDFDNSTALVANVNGPAILDSGTSLSYLPSNIANGLHKLLGGRVDKESGSYEVPCSIEGYLQFNFGELSINANFTNFFEPLVDDITGDLILDKEDQPLCITGIVESNTSFLLGDNFLRNAYVVYNLDKMEISLAQAKYGVSESKIETIDSNGVPSATTASQTSNSTAVETLAYKTFTYGFGDVYYPNGTSSHSKSHNGASQLSGSTLLGAVFALVYSVL